MLIFGPLSLRCHFYFPHGGPGLGITVLSLIKHIDSGRNFYSNYVVSFFIMK